MKYAAFFIVIAVHGLIVFYFSSRKEELPGSGDRVYFSAVLMLPKNKKEIAAPPNESSERVDVMRFPAQRIFIPDHEIFLIDRADSLIAVPEAGRKAQAIANDTAVPAKIFNRDKVDLASIDKELRAGKPGVPKERPDTPQRRLERGIADAFVGYAESVTDHYTSPDGVVYTRTTKNGRSSCFMSGGSNVIPSIMHNGSGASGAKSVNCPPPDSGWEK